MTSVIVEQAIVGQGSKWGKSGTVKSVFRTFRYQSGRLQGQSGMRALSRQNWRSFTHLRADRFGPKVGQSGTNPGLFKIKFQYILAR